MILRKTSHITCDCDWCIRFNWVIAGRRNGIDCVHTNTCDPSYVDRLILVRTRVSSYKKCTDQVLSEITIRMGGSYSIDVQSMVDILRKVLPERKNLDRRMVYNVNVRLRARRRYLELEVDNVEVLEHHFDTSFIEDYKSKSDNYSKG